MHNQAPIQPHKYSLYNEANNLSEAWNHIQAHIPVGQKNKFFALLMTYHNTLIHEMSK